MASKRVIGGGFGLADPVPAGAATSVVPDGDGVTFLATARSAIRMFAREASPAAVWMPSYHRPAVLDAFAELDCTVHFYPVDGDLQVDLDGGWWGRVESGDIVCFVDYFGRLASRDLFERARARGAAVLEDASQALLTVGVGEGADACVYSPRRLVGVAEGGVLVRAVPPVRAVPFDRAPDDWRRAQLGAAVARRDFDVRGARDHDRSWSALFRRAEDAPIGVFPMASFTRSMLLGSFDRDAIARRRVENWRVLAARLDSLSLFDVHVMEDEFVRGVVPVGFAARFADEGERDRVRVVLEGRSILADVEWDVRAHVPAEFEASRELGRRTLTLPCDQRYGAADMGRVADAVLAALGNGGRSDSV